jgi:hypothetical protein
VKDGGVNLNLLNYIYTYIYITDSYEELYEQKEKRRIEKKEQCDEFVVIESVKEDDTICLERGY